MQIIIIITGITISLEAKLKWTRGKASPLSCSRSENTDLPAPSEMRPPRSQPLAHRPSKPLPACSSGLGTLFPGHRGSDHTPLGVDLQMPAGSQSVLQCYPSQKKKKKKIEKEGQDERTEPIQASVAVNWALVGHRQAPN